ncbi:hypothetical protein DICPUDRAFT_148033 [Dictyostelium purpureum]|uniref:Peptidase M20 dimerisation domain-containing protein n=1 Tax=Dictyostelium purpureum TaxID=5786 RepID=F0ZA24_DICPU|nr:uncharacterized protein DICPUDRAFT_148033 [Dictyostelium purpureum]EGC39248.1 hypothetical protein DICPUDRAFT_148033 [Dictyostelium purpureum]|eukprot:XP_003284275.1 hypothetical protein DICPUDRAFT_148033 [Dictyostelium purpureum]
MEDDKYNKKKNRKSSNNGYCGIIKKTILYLFLGLIFIITFNTIRFTSKQPNTEPLTDDHIDSFTTLTEMELAQRLSNAIKFETISFGENEEFGYCKDEFKKLHGYFKEIFPRVNKHLELTVINNYSLVYHWKGMDSSLKPILLCGHMDVVPILNRERWTYAPFEGKIQDGYIWGRGSMDDKQTVMSILESIEDLLAQGYKPQRSFYLAFGHDEELGGDEGAKFINEHFTKAKIGPFEYILDEGLPIIVPPVFPGLNKPIAAVGVTEKGYVNVHLNVEIEGGHSSMPKRESAIGVLAKAVSKVEANPPSPSLSQIRKLFDFVGRECTLPYRIIFSNLWLFEPILVKVLSGKPTLDTLQRTTTALTIFNAGNKANVLPHQASALINFRVAPGNTVDEIIEHVRKTINDERVVITSSQKTEPAPVSSTDDPSFKLIQTTVLQEYPDVIVAPTIMVANTDTKHYWNLSKNIYRFNPLYLENSDLARFHGIDERISIKNYKQFVDFYYHLIKNSDRPLN